MIRPAVRLGLISVAVFALVVLAAGYAGRIVAIGDSLAVGRPHVVVFLLILSAPLLAFRAKALAIISVVAAFGAGSPILWGFVQKGQPETGQYTIYQKNLLGRAWPRYSLAADIIGVDPDFVALQEVSDHNLKFMANMFGHFPSQITCPFVNQKSVSVLSRHPMVPGSAGCGKGIGLAMMQVDIADLQPVWLVSVHLRWPFPYGQSGQVREIVQTLSMLQGPVLLAGDFNMVPWGSSVAALGKATNTRRVGPYKVTYPRYLPYIPFAIDHILLPTGGSASVTTRPLLGSDHLGLLARFDL